MSKGKSSGSKSPAKSGHGNAEKGNPAQSKAVKGDNRSKASMGNIKPQKGR